jgi:hypothetical protein
MHIQREYCFAHIQTAGRTISDLMRKLGERVLPDIMPIVDEGVLARCFARDVPASTRASSIAIRTRISGPSCQHGHLS